MGTGYLINDPEDGPQTVRLPGSHPLPDGVSLHRLHRRVLVPILQANPQVPVHAMSIGYTSGSMGRTRVDLRFTPPLALDSESMSPNELTDAVRDAILDLGGMPYVHQFGRAIKERD